MNISDYFIKSIEAKLELVKDEAVLNEIRRAGSVIVNVLKRGGSIYIAGNGGSASDAQHFSAELSGMFTHAHRQGLPVVALTANSSSVTAIANDFGFSEIFSRQLQGLGRDGDIFISISTSGNSRNLVSAVETAKNQGMTTISLLGRGGGEVRRNSDISIIVPSDNIQYIQECHIMIIHALCHIVDEAFS